MQRINFRKIADELKLSHMTLYRVINNAGGVKDSTRARVIETLNRHGYYMADQKKKQTIVFDFDESDLSYYMRDLMRQLMERISIHDFACVTTSHRTDRRRFLQEAEKAEVVVFGPMYEKRLLPLLKDLNPELLVINLLDDTVGDIAIASDDFQSGKIASEHLIKNGHTEHVAVTASLSGELVKHSFVNRAKGFLTEQRFSVPKCRIDLLDYPLVTKDDNRKFLDRTFRRWKKLPSAIFCTGSYMADQIFRYCAEKGIRIPEDLSLLGYDKPHSPEKALIYDRIYFEPEQIVNWAEFFLLNRPVLKTRDPIHVLLDTKLEIHGSVKNIRKEIMQ